MKKRSIIYYWLLLLVPTFVIGIFAFQLLRHEQERINQEVRFSARDRAQAIAETLQITVAAVEDGLSEALCAIEDGRLTETLLEWEESNPLLRNVFVWRPKAGLQYPILGATMTLEEKKFSARYGALFSGRVPWRSAGADTIDFRSSNALAPKKPNLVTDIKKLKTGRQKLVDLARGEGAVTGDAGSCTLELDDQAGWSDGAVIIDPRTGASSGEAIVKKLGGKGGVAMSAPRVRHPHLLVPQASSDRARAVLQRGG